MCNILIFGGTSEGRELAEFCAENMIPAFVSVATEYGGAILPKAEITNVLTGRKDKKQIQDFIISENISLVIDASHPYAKEATENITAACKAFDNVRYIRVVREKSAVIPGAIYFEDIEAIAAYLNGTNGNILITTGSKEIGKFCGIKNYRERCFARVLPLDENIEKCVSMGFDRAKIIAENGPFSKDENIKQITLSRAGFLVTKDSGKQGDFDEKVTAAEECGALLLILKRPDESGITLRGAKEILLEQIK